MIFKSQLCEGTNSLIPAMAMVLAVTVGLLAVSYFSAVAQDERSIISKQQVVSADPSSEAMVAYLLEEVENNRRAASGLGPGGSGELVGDSIEDIAELVARTPISTLPAGLLEIQKGVRAQGVDKATWNEVLSIAVLQLAEEPKSEARDSVLGPAVNHLANSWVGLALLEDDLTHLQRAVDFLRVGIDESSYAPARVHAGRLYGSLSMQLRGVAAEDVIFGFSAARDSFAAMESGPSKELVRELYVNSAMHLARSLSLAGDEQSAFERYQELLGDERNLSHFSSSDTRSSAFYMMATSAIRTNDPESASAGVLQAMNHLNTEGAKGGEAGYEMVDPLAMQYDIACRFESQFRGQGLPAIASIGSTLMKSGRYSEAITALKEVVVRADRADQDDLTIEYVQVLIDALVKIHSDNSMTANSRRELRTQAAEVMELLDNLVRSGLQVPDQLLEVARKLQDPIDLRQ